MESFTLTTPQAKPSVTKFDIAGIYETWLPVGSEQIEIRVIGSDGEFKSAIYGPRGLTDFNGVLIPNTSTGASILKAQNKANFSVNSRQKQIYQKMQTDGLILGSITGTPD